MSSQPAVERDVSRSRADQTGRSDLEDDLRGQLVAGLPVIERRLDVAGVSTAVLGRARVAEAKAGLRTLMLKLGIPAISREDLARIAVPTALIWGRHDQAIKLRVAEDASARYGWPLHVIDNARDDPKLERPEAFLRALRSALDSYTEPGVRDGGTT